MNSMAVSLLDGQRGGLNGWLEAGLFVLAISALTVVYAIAQQAGAHIIVFIVYAMSFAAAGMLALAGLGKNPIEVAFARESLVFGWSTVLLEAFYFLLLGLLTPAETSLALRLSVPVSLLVGWLLFRREMTSRLWLGSVIIVAAVVPLLYGVDTDVRVFAGILAVLCSLIVAVKTFSSEFHPANRAASTVREKLRVTGLVVLATTVIGVALLLPLVLLAAAGLVPDGGFIPPVAAFWHGPTLITAIVVGAPVFVAMTYLTFSSVVKIGTESFLATSAFTPFSVLAIESLAAAAGFLTLGTFDRALLPFIALGIVGVLIVVHARHHGG